MKRSVIFPVISVLALFFLVSCGGGGGGGGGTVIQEAQGVMDWSFLSPTFSVTWDGGISDYGNALAVQSDGKILVTGYSNNGTDYDVVLIRYNVNGSLDTGFGTSGAVTWDGGSHDSGRALAVQSDGKILVTGYSNNGTDTDVVLLRIR